MKASKKPYHSWGEVSKRQAERRRNFDQMLWNVQAAGIIRRK